ncbi:YihY/virulence factor BrkB family protein [Croceicoccus estronivorus]|uniref:YihY/virulence factor BrkB family protein n=1 Tax=Croceicoccus estronivorus TaxID=1172626 RepID=UPI0009EF148B|nr:YihY/virulence factor BrkB family protein [Croceicoccus estronivorus]
MTPGTPSSDSGSSARQLSRAQAGPPRPDYSPEARRKAALASPETFSARFHHYVGPGSRAYEVIHRAVVGTWNDGFIHAGNLAYMAMFAIFPFFILGAAALSLLGDAGDQAASLTSVLDGLPPRVSGALIPVAESVIAARSGWLLWAGGLAGLWTTTSLIETIRDVLRRAYGTPPTLSFWRYRLISTGVTLGAVMLLMISLLAHVLIGALREAVSAWLPQFDALLSGLSLSRIVPILGLFGSMFLIFLMLTPAAYRSNRYPKWPGALAVTAWTAGVTVVLPPLMRTVFAYDLTYGSLAGAMIALFFFWLVGLGIVAGAELNAALARTPEEEEAEA